MSRINVLIIDDDLELSKGLTEKLNLNGFNAQYALNGKDGLKKIQEMKERPFDAVVCDLVMPGMRGNTVFEEMRKIDPYICFIMLTGYAEIQEAIQLVKMGAYQYFSKPFEGNHFEEFFLTIKRGVTSKKIGKFQEEVLSTPTLDINVIFGLLTKAVEVIFSPREYCLVIIEKNDEDRLDVVEFKGLPSKPVLQKRGFIKTVLETKEYLFVEKISESNYDSLLPLLKDAKSLIAVPLIVSGNMYGIIEIEGTKPNDFTHLDLESLKEFGKVVSIALHNFRSFNLTIALKEQIYKGNIIAFNAMTHQFKTPIHHIQLTVSALLDQIETKSIQKIKEGLHGIYKSSEMAEDMIRKVLLNYKDEEKQDNLSVIFDRVKNSFKGIPAEAGVTISWPNENIDVDLSCKSGQIGFIFQTIIENGLDAIRGYVRKDGMIEIKSEIIGDKVKLEFKDNGVGIKDCYRDTIFNKIFSSKPDNVGNGIGLFLCKNFIDGHKGEICFESEPGNTRFYVTLPLKKR